MRKYVTDTSTTTKLATYNRRIRTLLRNMVNQHDRQAYYMLTTGLCLGWCPNPVGDNLNASMLASNGRLRFRIERQHDNGEDEEILAQSDDEADIPTDITTEPPIFDSRH